MAKSVTESAHPIARIMKSSAQATHCLMDAGKIIIATQKELELTAIFVQAIVRKIARKKKLNALLQMNQLLDVLLNHRVYQNKRIIRIIFAVSSNAPLYVMQQNNFATDQLTIWVAKKQTNAYQKVSAILENFAQVLVL